MIGFMWTAGFYLAVVVNAALFFCFSCPVAFSPSRLLTSPKLAVVVRSATALCRRSVSATQHHCAMKAGALAALTPRPFPTIELCIRLAIGETVILLTLSLHCFWRTY